MSSTHKVTPNLAKQKSNALNIDIIKNLENEFANNNFSYVEQQCTDLIKTNPKAFFLYNILGLAQLNQNNFEEALGNFQKTLNFSKDNINIYLNIADASIKIGNLHQASQAYHKALDLNPNQPETWKNLSNLKHKLGEYEKALECLENTFKYNLQDTPNDHNILFIKAILLMKLERYDYAEKILKECLKQKPNHIEAHINLSNVYNNLELYEVAFRSICNAFSIDKNNENAAHTLGTILDNLNQSNLAKDMLKNAITQNNKCPYLHFYMGAILRQENMLNEAIIYFDKAINLKPDYTQAYLNIGHIYSKKYKHKDSLKYYAAAIDCTPTSCLSLVCFAQTIRKLHNFSNLRLYQKHIKACLDHPEVESSLVSDHASYLIQQDLSSIKLEDLLSTQGLSELCNLTGGLINSYLSTAVVTNIGLEDIFSRIRKALFRRHLENNSYCGKHTNIAELSQALAIQSFLNEYIWYIESDELKNIQSLKNNITAKMDNSDKVDPYDLTILALYEPLHKNVKITSWTKHHFNELDEPSKKVYKKLVIEPELEKEIAQNLKKYTEIDDETSNIVKSQYEENPYPRWDSISHTLPVPYTNIILNEILPNKPKIELLEDTQEILIAGCGTGKQPISAALQYKNSNIVAIDLSKTSLSYAIRKAQELSIENINFGLADILKLGELNQTFDLIECCGVLHHMEQPEIGLQKLLKILKPGGFIKLGLYSEIARRSIIKIKNKLNANNPQLGTDEIRKLRTSIEKNNLEIHRELSNSRDYYTTSTFRDLILHVQEHRFTITQLKQILSENNLEFLGFLFLDPTVKTNYLENYPNDPGCTNLDNWHSFEQNNPDTFLGMYNFWSQKMG